MITLLWNPQEEKTCPDCGATHPGMSQKIYSLIGLFALLLGGMCAFPVLSAEDSYWMKPDESMTEWDRRLDADASVRDRIRCLDP